MPHFTITISPGGPLIDAYVCVSAARQQVLVQLGNPVPSPVQVRALIDTGASCTCVDQTVPTLLGLSPTGSVPVHTPSTVSITPHQANQYDALIVIPGPTGTPPFVSGTTPVLDADLAHQGFQALIGRDILSRCLLIYDGRAGILSLAF